MFDALQIKRAAISTSPAGSVYDLFEVFPKPGASVSDLDLQCRLHTVLYAHRLQQQREQQEQQERERQGQGSVEEGGHKRLRSDPTPSPSPPPAAAGGGGGDGGNPGVTGFGSTLAAGTWTRTAAAVTGAIGVTGPGNTAAAAAGAGTSTAAAAVTGAIGGVFDDLDDDYDLSDQ